MKHTGNTNLNGGVKPAFMDDAAWTQASQLAMLNREITFVRDVDACMSPGTSAPYYHGATFTKGLRAVGDGQTVLTATAAGAKPSDVVLSLALRKVGWIVDDNDGYFGLVRKGGASRQQVTSVKYGKGAADLSKFFTYNKEKIDSLLKPAADQRHPDIALPLCGWRERYIGRANVTSVDAFLSVFKQKCMEECVDATFLGAMALARVSPQGFLCVKTGESVSNTFATVATGLDMYHTDHTMYFGGKKALEYKGAPGVMRVYDDAMVFFSERYTPGKKGLIFDVDSAALMLELMHKGKMLFGAVTPMFDGTQRAFLVEAALPESHESAKELDAQMLLGRIIATAEDYDDFYSAHIAVQAGAVAEIIKRTSGEIGYEKLARILQMDKCAKAKGKKKKTGIPLARVTLTDGSATGGAFNFGGGDAFEIGRAHV